MHAKLDFAADILNQAEGPEIHEASLRLAVAQMYGLLMQFDPSALTDKLGEDPRCYIGLLDVLAKLTNGGLNYKRHAQLSSWGV